MRGYFFNPGSGTCGELAESISSLGESVHPRIISQPHLRPIVLHIGYLYDSVSMKTRFDSSIDKFNTNLIIGVTGKAVVVATA